VKGTLLWLSLRKGVYRAVLRPDCAILLTLVKNGSKSHPLSLWPSHKSVNMEGAPHPPLPLPPLTVCRYLIPWAAFF